MKKYILYFTLIYVLLLEAPVTLFSQTKSKIVTSEKVELFSDRSLYIAGEQLYFYAKIYNSDITQMQAKSQILYCELISPDGIKISGSKYLLKESSTEGWIIIPKEQISGIYYLRAYTKAMRNYGPEAYSYIQLKIVNSQSDELLLVENSTKSNSLIMYRDSTQLKKNLFSVDLNKQVFSPDETVSFSIRSDTENFDSAKNEICISVIPDMAVSVPMAVQQTKLTSIPGEVYFAEDQGLSLSGKLTGTRAVPLPGKVVSLSIIGEGRDFMATRTDTAGRFFFALPDYKGKRDLFLIAEKTNLPDIKIWVDNDFCALPVHLPSPEFILTDEERKAAQYMAANLQIESHFKTDTIEKITPLTNDKAFYGEPTTFLDIDQFVQLPTLEECFNELPGQVKVRKRSGEKYFKVIGAYDLSFYDPLILVDWVAVDEPSRILAIAPRNVSRIEIVNQLYVKGEQTYGGIISIISHKGDFAGIDLPSTGIFINFRFLAHDQCKPKPEIVADNFPDVRNTILWKPGISLQNNTLTNFSFKAPYTPGKYTIALEGITPEGKRFSVKHSFAVSN